MPADPASKDTTEARTRPAWRGLRLAPLLGFAACVALGVAAFGNSGNPVVAMLAFGAWAVFLTRLAIELLSRLFGVNRAELDRYRREEVLEYLSHVRAASAASRSGRHDEAVTHLEAADNLQPGRLDVALPLAEALRRTGRLDEAVRLLEAVKVLHAGAPALHFELARSHCLAGDLKQAGEELELAGAIDPALGLKAAREPDFQALRGWIVRTGEGR